MRSYNIVINVLVVVSLCQRPASPRYAVVIGSQHSELEGKVGGGIKLPNRPNFVKYSTLGWAL